MINLHQIRQKLQQTDTDFTFIEFGENNTISLINGLRQGSVERLVKMLRKEGLALFFHDTLHPTLSDPGAYFSYFRKAKNAADTLYYLLNEPTWGMTLGNHGWSGGIYHIPESTIIAQLMAITTRKGSAELRVEEKGWFTDREHDDAVASLKENERILHYLKK